MPIEPPTNAPKSGTIWLHVKSRRVYRIKGLALAEATHTWLVLYFGADFITWARPLREFTDGRFRELTVEQLAALPPHREKQQEDFQ